MSRVVNISALPMTFKYIFKSSAGLNDEKFLEYVIAGNI
jgi:hypothetical protein